MVSVEEIETAIDQLPPDEYRRVAAWFHAREESRWDEQLDRDSSAGKLKFLFREADEESAQGRLRKWPTEA